MSDRLIAQSQFLATTPWEGWIQNNIAQDASARSYTRLSRGADSVILMDAPPQAGEDVVPFVFISEELRSMRLAAPEILRKDVKLGFLILEDLGPTNFAQAMAENPDSAQKLYHAAADVLIHIAKQPVPHLQQLDPETAGDMVRVTAEQYAERPAIADALAQNICRLFQKHCQVQQSFALRDFHAENLIWRSQKSELQRVGLLDFQDAIIAPSGYDLASLLRDARRDIDKDLATDILLYVATQSGEPVEQLSLRVRCLAIQRNLRILGVFARLIRIQGKTRYTAMLPRVWRYIKEDLDHPALTDLRILVRENLPPPQEFMATL